MKKKLPYADGSIFKIVLDSEGLAYGLVLLSGQDGKVLIGRFFKSDCDISGNLKFIEEIFKKQKTICTRFSDLGLMTKRWPVIGNIYPWLKSEWPIPLFRIQAPRSSRSTVLRYVDNPSQPEETFDVEGAPIDVEIDYMRGFLSIEDMLIKERCLAVSDLRCAEDRQIHSL
jgi:hypothetical protein